MPALEELNMKMVTAIIKPFKLDEVREALSDIGVQGITVTEVKGFGRQKGHRAVPRRRVRGGLSSQGQVEAAVADDLVDRVIEAIEGAARTGKIGDGKILCPTSNRWCASAPAKPARKPSEAPPYPSERNAMKNYLLLSSWG